MLTTVLHGLVGKTLAGPLRTLVRCLREADVLWTSELEHAVECVQGNRDLDRSTLIGARS